MPCIYLIKGVDGKNVVGKKKMFVTESRNRCSDSDLHRYTDSKRSHFRVTAFLLYLKHSPCYYGLEGVTEMKICIFDLDGTLTDTLDSLVYSTNAVLTELGLAQITKEQCRMFVGNGAAHQISCALKAAGDPQLLHFDEAMESYMRIFSQHCTDQVVPYEGIVQVLKELKEKRIRIAVHSNKPHSQAEDVVKAVFGEAFFDMVQGQQDDLPRKPDPAGAYRIMERLGAAKEETIYVGDSEVDIRTGMNAGVKTVGVTWGFRGEKLLRAAGAKNMIDRPEELLHYVL